MFEFDGIAKTVCSIPRRYCYHSQGYLEHFLELSGVYIAVLLSMTL